MSDNLKKRVSGILLHPTSLPSPYGIGDLGKEAYDFIDFLHQSGQHIWQVLPLTPTGFGDSPYQSFSAFAGQPLLISPAHLVELSLLSQEDLTDCPVGGPTKVDYGEIIPWKNRLLHKAFDHFTNRPKDTLWIKYTDFCKENADWLEDYALFMSCKSVHEGRDWLSWEASYKNPTPEFRAVLLKELSEEIGYYSFVQFLFFTEWFALKEYANKKEIRIIGDIPIFVSMDSADVWANKHLFQLDAKGYPLAVAGVPPDYFSETGQLWGNPLYDWNAHKAEKYAWWTARIRRQLCLTDYVRIDHFRGFESYWSVPAGEETAVNGKWIKGPDADLFEAMQRQLGDDLPIIAEDLGIITPEVEALRDRFGFPGMKVLQFAFNTDGESTFLPHQLTTTNCICYTGTHDNDTTRGWYENAPEVFRDKVRRYMNTDGGRIHRDFIRTCLGTIATYAIIPMQDVLGLGTEARMNTPSVAENNWSWRFCAEDLQEYLAKDLAELTVLYGR